MDLRSLLRAELTAVNQQFIHVLALRRSGDKERAARIYEVDVVDFPNAMRVLDRIAASGEPIRLPFELPQPGGPLRSLLQSELRIEDRLRRILAMPGAPDPGAQHLVDAAASPRAAYRAWLADEIGTATDFGNGKHYPAIDPLFSCLILVLEHWMARAFVAWHAGDRQGADIAWAISGVAMVQVTDFVNALTDLNGVPLEAASPPQDLPAILGESHGERELMTAYARLAHDAAKSEGDPTLQAICAKSAAYTDALTAWRSGVPHPAQASCAPAFRSFAATYQKFVKEAV